MGVQSDGPELHACRSANGGDGELRRNAVAMHILPPLMTLTRVSRRYPPAMTMAAPPKNMPTPPLVPPAPFITDTILQSNRGRSFISPEKRRRRGTEQDPRDHTEQDHVERQLPHRIERAEHHVEEEPHRHQPSRPGAGVKDEDAACDREQSNGDAQDKVEFKRVPRVELRRVIREPDDAGRDEQPADERHRDRTSVHRHSTYHTISGADPDGSSHTPSSAPARSANTTLAPPGPISVRGLTTRPAR